MTGGMIISSLTIRESEIFGVTILVLITPIFMLENITSMRAGTTSMKLDVGEVVFTVITSINIQTGTPIIIIIFTMFKKTSISMGVVRIQVLCSSSTWTEGRMTILGIIDAERSDNLLKGISKRSRHLEERQDHFNKFKHRLLDLSQYKPYSEEMMILLFIVY